MTSTPSAGGDRADEEESREQVSELADPEGKLAHALESQHWSDRERREWGDARIGRLLEAARSSPYWADRLDGVSALEQLEPLGRERLREGFDSIASGVGGPAVSKLSSGSSGRPVRVLLGAEQIGYGAAGRLRQLVWFGRSTGPVRSANLAGRSHADDPPLRRVRGDPPQFLINPWALDRANLSAVHDEIVAAGGVELIGANTSIFELLATLYREVGIDGRELGCRLAIVGSELTDDSQRRVVAEVFGCRVAEMYGAREAPVIGTECAHGSLHINEDAFRVEVLGEDGMPAAPGELGSVALTHLHNVEFPLLRYQLGDAASFLEGACACGSTLARLDIAVGHLEEMLLKRDGSMVHPNFVRNAYEHAFGARLRAFHTVQLAPGRFVVYIDVEDLTGREGEAAAASLSATLGEPVELEFVTDPDRARNRLPSGKLRAFTREC